MKLTNKTIIEQCMTRIELLQLHAQNIDAAVILLNQEKRWEPVDVGNLRNRMIQLELDEWRKLAMWGLTLDGVERDRVKAAVHDRFLRDGMHVADWFRGGGTSPGSWLSSDEDAFRKMAKAAFSPNSSAGLPSPAIPG